MNQFIIATHSILAQGFYEAVKFFNSEINNLDYINAYTDSPEFQKILVEKLKKYQDNNIIVLTDMAGGSVNQVAAQLMDDYKFQLITGINLSMVLEFVFNSENLTSERIQEIVEKNKEQVIYMNKIVGKISSENEEL